MPPTNLFEQTFVLKSWNLLIKIFPRKIVSWRHEHVWFKYVLPPPSVRGFEKPSSDGHPDFSPRWPHAQLPVRMEKVPNMGKSKQLYPQKMWLKKFSIAFKTHSQSMLSTSQQVPLSLHLVQPVYQTWLVKLVKRNLNKIRPWTKIEVNWWKSWG